MAESPEISKALIKYALLNAYAHGGRAESGAIVGKVIAEFPNLKSQAKNLFHAARVMIDEINSLSIAQQISRLENEFPKEFANMHEKRDEKKQLPPLEDATRGKVVTRFPPEPNGYPHIGHAKAALIGYKYAKMYDGKFILRFDDTNPIAERIEYYDALTSGLEWLGIKPDIIKNTSDDIDQIYRLAKKMIESGHLYICECERSRIKANRAKGKNCDHRDTEQRILLEKWEMLFSEYREHEAVVRFKGNMMDLNTALRDPTMMRIIDHPHPLTGEKYRVWPTYDLASPIEDSIDGVTHAMRSKEYELRDPLYYLILDILGIHKPHLIEFSRLEMRDTPVSKRVFRPLIEEGKVEGWNDPRLPTLIGLRRRGFTPDAVKEFIDGLGVGKSESEPTWDLLESINRKLIDPITRRYFFVPVPVLLHVDKAPQLSVKLKHHPEKDLGERVIVTGNTFFITRSDAEQLRKGDSIRLMDLFNVTITEIGETLSGEYDGKDMRAGIKKIQWVPENSIPFIVKIPRALFKDGEYNENSLETFEGIAEPACISLKKDEYIQFARFGFCKVDGLQIAIMTHK